MLALFQTLEALRQKPGTKMLLFGVTALDRFKCQLKEYSGFAQAVNQLSENWFQVMPSLQEFVQYACRGEEAPGAKNAQAQSSKAGRAGAAGAQTQGAQRAPGGVPGSASLQNTNIAILLSGGATEAERVVAPPESVQDKVFFLFNNLSKNSAAEKVDELKRLLGGSGEYLAWAAQYLVVKRVSTESNFHAVYSEFVDLVALDSFSTAVLAETYRNIKILLRSDKGSANFSDRTLLKNLGHWLGLRTLAKNRPILSEDLDLKTLIYEAYNRSTEDMLYVIPFVAKILESANQSVVFRPPNPWLVGILAVLAELQREENVKLNLKFEIEVLCKSLAVDLNTLPAVSFLHDRSRLGDVESQLEKPASTTAVTTAPASTAAASAAPASSALSTDLPLAPNLPAPVPLPSDLQSLFLKGPYAPRTDSAAGQQHPEAENKDEATSESASASALVPTTASSPQAVSGVGGPALAQSPPTAAGSAPQGAFPVFSYTFEVVQLDRIRVLCKYNEQELCASTAGSLATLSAPQWLSILQAMRPKVQELVEQAVRYVLGPSFAPDMERSVRDACETSVLLVAKDFALDPDDRRFAFALGHMVRHTSCALALAGFHREPVLDAFKRALLDEFVKQTKVRLVV